MKLTWMERYYIRLATAAKGRGITLPWVGKTQMKRQNIASQRYVDECPNNWRIYWRAKSHTKLNNRDIRHIEGNWDSDADE
jgi:hypothetical protein